MVAPTLVLVCCLSNVNKLVKYIYKKLFNIYLISWEKYKVYDFNIKQ